MADAGDSAELTDFRERWKAEVRERLHTSSNATSQLDSKRSVELNGFAPSSGADSLQFAPVRPCSDHSSGRLSSAVHIYRLAVQKEQQGHLDEALALYRHAFRLDPNVDRAFSNAEQVQSTFSNINRLTRPQHPISGGEINGISFNTLSLAPSE